MRYRFFIILFSALLPAYALASSSDSIVNEYYAVTEVLYSGQKDGVIVDNPGTLTKGDTVLIYQTKGVKWNYTEDNADDYHFAGKFEIQLVDTVISDTVKFKGKLGKTLTLEYNADYKVQLVKIPSYRYFKVTQKLTAAAWDGNKGGILIFITDTLDLQANIDVTGKGFRGYEIGADSSAGYCTSDDSIAFAVGNFLLTSIDSGGLKGESNISNDFFRRGNYDAFTGGGGGNGYHSGGGGGSNWGIGGNGGYELDVCGESNNLAGGIGGQAILDGIYLSGEVKAIFGGGGGSSTQKKPFIATKGGNGGGAIIFVANFFKGNNYKIIANGANVTQVATAGGGGGGGGGAILADINEYSSPATFSVKGGDGGNTSSLAGGGGGGGGGYVLFNQKPFNVTVDTSLSERGKSASNKRYGSRGDYGRVLSGLTMPVNELLFNFMPHDTTICENDTPNEIRASKPKGWSGAFKYEWYKSEDSTNWTLLGGKDTLYRYQPPALQKTTYYFRIVYAVNKKDSIVATDVSKAIKITVEPKIENNFIHTDTIQICKNKKYPILDGTNPTGGYQNYKFLWQDSITGNWQTAKGLFTDTSYNPNSNYDTSVWFRRIVTTTKCISKSNAIKITYLPTLENIKISDTVWVEKGRIPNPLSGEKTVGGNDTIDYQWQYANILNEWNNLTGDTLQNLTLPIKNDTVYFRRVVTSGQYNTCSDTSNIIPVYVIDSLYNNNVNGTSLICAKTRPSTFICSTPSGGDGEYTYLWEKKTTSSNWVKDTLIKATNYQPNEVNEETYFRRIVLSGHNDACKDTSPTIIITTKPFIDLNTISGTKDLICKGQHSGALSGSNNVTGGDGTPYLYQWEYFKKGMGWTTIASSQTVNSPGLTLDDTTQIRRVVSNTSGLCTSISNYLTINVLPSIINNLISPNRTVCKGTSPELFNEGSHQGGDPAHFRYQWIQSKDNESWQNANGDSAQVVYQAGVIDTAHYFKRIVISGSNDCCIDTSSKTITIDTYQLPIVSFASEKDSMCAKDKHIIPLKITGTAPFSIDFNDGFETKTINNIASSNFNLEFSTDIQEIYNIRVTRLTDANNCNAKTMTGNAEIHSFTIPNSKAGTDTTVCGLTVKLNAIPSIGNGIWNSSSLSITNATEPDAIFEAESYGPYYVTWKETNGVCSDSSKIKVTFYEQYETVDGGKDIAQPYLFETKLDGQFPSNYTGYYWSTNDPEIIISDTANAQTQVTNLRFGVNKFIWTILNGTCKPVKDTVTIAAIDLDIPNGFSPNGDNINPTFFIQGLEFVANSNLTIFNKWGNKVYESSDYQNDWDGKKGGVELPSDTYYYILKTTIKSYQGYVIIKR